jgi:hypothetical protein
MGGWEGGMGGWEGGRVGGWEGGRVGGWEGGRVEPLCVGLWCDMLRGGEGGFTYHSDYWIPHPMLAFRVPLYTTTLHDSMPGVGGTVPTPTATSSEHRASVHQPPPPPPNAPPPAHLP